MLETISPELRAYQDDKLKQFKKRNPQEAKNGIVFAGDSLIDFYPLKKWLGRDLPLINRGIAGTHSRWLLEHLDSQIRELKPAKVFVLIGTNDLGLGREPEAVVKTISEIVAELNEVLYAEQIYVLSLLPVNQNQKFKQTVKIRSNQAIRTVNKALADLSGCIFIDLYHDLLDERGNLAEGYTVDGLHLTPAAYQCISDRIKAYL
ncbi:SGNH/GDSL hydrolase family protein [Streptococcus pantholopis]|uniref:Lipase n=1 Tax=Streptococcus pantholopis TaxID=1811193 RepID=A0A172Q722_9STRE|nr:SGNH/GDSL hydrolase family protein [Streptococcus pantholopis]AND79289.1 lipase [Streptococcus pantholopis]